MKKIYKRLIVFFIGVPALLSVVVFFPGNNHLLLNLILLVFSVLGAMEFRKILALKNLHISAAETIVLSAIFPASWIMTVSFGFKERFVFGAFVLGATWLMISLALADNKKLDSCLGRVTAGFAVMVYPGLFMAWVIKMAAFSQASMVILVFFLVVLLNDAAAWAAGNLWGKGNRGLVAASPNKSIAGFISGLAFSVITGIAAVVLIPSAFSSGLMASIPAGALLGLLAGAAATLGDLAESAIKRSVGISDSGSLILGRGGALDSIDSVALAAPVYFLIYQFLFGA